MADVSNSHYIRLLQQKHSHKAPVLTVLEEPPIALTQLVSSSSFCNDRQNVANREKPYERSALYIETENIELEHTVEELEEQMAKCTNSEIQTYKTKLDIVEAEVEQYDEKINRNNEQKKANDDEIQCLNHALSGFFDDLPEEKHQKYNELCFLLTELNNQLNEKLLRSSANFSQFDKFEKANELLETQNLDLEEQNERIKLAQSEAQLKIEELQKSQAATNSASNNDIDLLEKEIANEKQEEKLQISKIQQLLREECNKSKIISKAVNQLKQFMQEKNEQYITLKNQLLELEQEIFTERQILDAEFTEKEEIQRQKQEFTDRAEFSVETLYELYEALEFIVFDLEHENVSLHTKEDVQKIISFLDNEYLQYQHTHDCDVNEQTFFRERSSSCPAELEKLEQNNEQQYTQLDELLEKLENETEESLNLTVDASTLEELQRMMKAGQLNNLLANNANLEFQVYEKPIKIVRKKIDCECDSIDGESDVM